MCGICGFTIVDAPGSAPDDVLDAESSSVPDTAPDTAPGSAPDAAPGSPADRATLKAMCDVMAHRGPDGEGQHFGRGIALGHRRLSLIDLEGGAQPMVRGQWAIVFNGEIYNYRELRAELQAQGHQFATNSDTEVLLVGYIAWSEAVLQRLRGMFAFAIWNAGTRELFCARDFFGIKPFYYTQARAETGVGKEPAGKEPSSFPAPASCITPQLQVCLGEGGSTVGARPCAPVVESPDSAIASASVANERATAETPSISAPTFAPTSQFIFASEIKSILEHPAYHRALNEEALAQYLCFQFNPLQETFFRGIYKLPPGHCLRVSADGAVEVARYWRPEFRPDESRPEPATVDAIDQAIRESVRYHNVADVEVGSFLSSGIDSSYLAACLARENPAIQTFTVGFSEYEGERDEISWAGELAGRLGIANDAHHITEEEYWQVLPRVQWHMDEPTADPSAVALYFVDRIAARRVKAVLSGEGADEFFGGYRIYQAPLENERVGKVPRPLLRVGSRMLRAAGRRGANYLERASERVEDWYYTNANGVAFSPDERDCLLAPALRDRLARTCHPGDPRSAIGLGACHIVFVDDLHNPGFRSAEDVDGEGPSGDAAPLTREGCGDSLATVGIPAPQQLTAPVYAEAAAARLDEPTRMQYVDLWFWLVGDILLKTDKMAMAHSLESRVPFLDRKVFRVAASIPTAQKVTREQTKVALRQAAERAIPSDWAQKEKLGFPVPVAAWLRENRYYELVKREFTSARAMRFFDVKELLRLLDEHRAGADRTRRIWIVYSFLVWYRVFFDE